MTDHLTSPEPHHGPFGHLSDADLLATHQRTSLEPDNPTAVAVLAEMERRGLSA